MSAVLETDDRRVDLGALYAESNIGETINQLDNDLVGLLPVKTRIREIAALLLVESARRGLGIQTEPPAHGGRAAPPEVYPAQSRGHGLTR